MTGRRLDRATWVVLLASVSVACALSLAAEPAAAALALLPAVAAGAVLVSRPTDTVPLARLAWGAMAVGLVAVVVAILAAVLDEAAVVGAARFIALAAGVSWLVLLLAGRAVLAGHPHVSLDLAAAVVASAAVVALVRDTTGVVALAVLCVLLGAVVPVTGSRTDRQLLYVLAAAAAGSVAAGSLAVSEERISANGIDDVRVVVSFASIIGTGSLLALLSLAARMPASRVVDDRAVGDLSFRRMLLSSAAAVVAVAVLAAGTAPADRVAMAVAVLALVLWGVRAWFAAREEVAVAVARRQAETDDLTGLPNRRGFTRRCARELRGTERVVVLLLDLDGFKLVNDSLGHPVGDDLLRHVAHLLSRRAAAEGFRVARLGGDEFVVWGSDVTAAEAQWFADGLLQELAEPVELAGVHVRTMASIGIAAGPEHGTGVVELLRRADLAMYAAKEDSRGRTLAGGTSTATGESPLLMADELAEALAGHEEHGRLVVRYQPIVALRDSRLLGVEALSRWQHPVRGEQTPSSFLSLASTTGLLSRLTDHVLSQVVRDLAGWQGAGVAAVPVSVNLSPADIADPQLVQRVLGPLEGLRLDRGQVVVEVSEDTVMVDATDAVRVLRLLRDGGVGVALDDFGTGRSSLAYLRTLPLTSLKLDRSLLVGLEEERERRFLRAIAGLAHALCLPVVAEGVEEQAWVQRLLELGFDAGQGYALGGPMTADELRDLLSVRRPVR